MTPLGYWPVPLLLLEARKAVNAHHWCIPSADSGRRCGHESGTAKAPSPGNPSPWADHNRRLYLAQISVDENSAPSYDSRATE